MLSINQMTSASIFLIKLETPFPRHSFLIMITRRDVDSVRNLFGAQEAIYWVMHPIERVQTVQQIDEWDGYFWTMACNNINEADKRGDWTLFFDFICSIFETHLRDQMEELLQSASKRLFEEYTLRCQELGK